MPSKNGAGYEVMPELEPIAPFKDKVSVFSGFRAMGDGRANLVHWSGHASILSGIAPAAASRFDGPSFDTKIADAIGASTRFKTIDIDASMSRQPVSYSTRTGSTFSRRPMRRRWRCTRAVRFGLPGSRTVTTGRPTRRSCCVRACCPPSPDQRQALMASVGKADQVKLDQYFSSVRDMENQLAVQLRKPEKREACVVPSAPKEPTRGASVDIVNANTRTMAKLLAMGLACNQTRVFTFVHTAGSSETYMAGQSKIYHQITHDEPTDAKLGYQPETSKLAGQVMQGLGAFLTELDAIKEGDRTLLDNSLRHGVQRHRLREDPCDREHSDVSCRRRGGRYKAGPARRGQGRLGDARVADRDATGRRAGGRVRQRLDEDLGAAQ